ncbi:hydroxymethylglutaryl-CoA synthase [Candidatus Atribacteria bacterium HGW-Atribacteria-1]|nr:MAG: hydroxymethylglutaryl-CoA synthase [Candidatus Atribacteria bacterium HGW-Atribacteria-1]
MVGIVGYGAYIPKYRIKVEEIAKVWGEDAEALKKGLLLEEKTVPFLDQDSVTIGVEGAKNALKRALIDPQEIGAVYIGSESPPYAVKPSSSIIAEVIGATPQVHTADYEFACKAGSESVFVCYSLVKAGLIKYGLGIGADTSQGAPHEALEYSAAAGGAAYIIGEEDTLADILETFSYTTDTPDFWRRDGEFYPRHGGRFTGDPAYFKHVLGSARGIMDKAGLKPEDFTYAVFHQPNGKFPLRAGKMLGFSMEQLKSGLVAPKIGNTYSGCSLLGLAATLDISKPGDLILITSFGSGAGSDSFIIKVKEKINKVRHFAPTVCEMLDDKIYIDYGKYIRYRRMLKV